MSDLIGQSLGRYHIIERLGEGGMATVYKAYDTRLERDAAIKIIRRDVFPPIQLETILKRFEREAKALARLTHPNIVSVIDYGEQDGIPYLVMVYLPGGTLKQRLGKPIPWQKAIRLLLPIAHALQFAHSQKIVHRDVKPSNILISLSGEPMLSDFGIAKILEGEGVQTLTGTGVGVGTPEYMAPEQWTGQAGPLSDIYSLGVVLYELVTGRKPYVADTPAAVLLKQLNDPLPRPRQYASDLPEAVEKLIFKALARKPEDRYPEMGAMAVALEGLLAGAGRISPPARAKKDNVHSASVPEEATRDALSQEIARGKAPSGDPSGGEPASSRPPTRKIKFISFGIGAVAVLVLIGAILGINYIAKNRPAASVPTSTITSTISSTATFTVMPTHIPTSTFTPKPLPTNTRPPNPVIGSTWRQTVDGMNMVYIPGGEFKMGSYGGDSNERPVHTVYLDAYWIDQTEVTNSMYIKCVQDNGCNPIRRTYSSTRSSYFGDSTYDYYPVIYVDWTDARNYCVWAGRRLPTEAEWEKAARGTDGRTYPWGEGIDCAYANYGGCVGDTTKVGSYQNSKSPYGVYDMAGNVLEWVASWYEVYPGGDPNASSGFGQTSRVLRGGSWNPSDGDPRSTTRLWDRPSNIRDGAGFRCARTP